jgi:hypothetical protein
MAQTRESLRRGLATNDGLLGRTWCRYIAAVGSVNLAGWPWCRWFACCQRDRGGQTTATSRRGYRSPKSVCEQRGQGRGLLGLHREGQGCRRWPGTPRTTSSRGGAVAMQQMGRGTEERRRKMQARGGTQQARWAARRIRERERERYRYRHCSREDTGGDVAGRGGESCAQQMLGDIPAWRC